MTISYIERDSMDERNNSMGIVFKVVLSELGSRKIIRLPLSASERLPSRGMVMVQGMMNGVAFQAPLEPDGRGSHWLEVSDILGKGAGTAIGQTISFDIEPVDEWAEPEIPEDIMDAIIKAGLTNQWKGVTTKARWEWLRWIRDTKNPATRKKRIDVACSKMRKGDKRPCCFNAASCTVPDVSKSGMLLD